MFPGFDPSKMDPKVLMELSSLVRQLPPDRIAKMQSLMHNMMVAGFDVRKEMEEFEKTLPPEFRQKVSALMASQPIPTASAPEPAQSTEDLGLREARITILRAVADGRMSPEEAEKLLFHS